MQSGDIRLQMPHLYLEQHLETKGTFSLFLCWPFNAHAGVIGEYKDDRLELGETYSPIPAVMVSPLTGEPQGLFQKCVL